MSWCNERILNWQTWASCHAVDDDRVLAVWRDIQEFERLGYIRLKFYI